VTDRPRLSAEEAQRVLAGVRPIPARKGASPIAISDLVGTTLDGEPASVGLTRRTQSTLLLFVSPTCNGCQELFEASHDLASLGLRGDDDLVFVFKEQGGEQVGLAAGIMAIVSPKAWDDYGVTGPPFFSFVDPSRATVFTEGVAWGSSSINDAVTSARDGNPTVEVGRLTPPPAGRL
jgi:hypothetical protein